MLQFGRMYYLCLSIIGGEKTFQKNAMKNSIIGKHNGDNNLHTSTMITPAFTITNRQESPKMRL